MPPKLATDANNPALATLRARAHAKRCARCTENGLECNVLLMNRNLGIECDNCADYRFQYDPNCACTISGRAKPLHRKYSKYHPQLFTPNTACDRCVVDKRETGCDVDNILNYSCSRCRGKTCRLTNGKVMDTRPNLRQGVEKWFRHACDGCHNINVSKRHTNVICNWLADRGAWKSSCHRCEDETMACYQGGMLTGLPPVNGPEIRNWESKALISGGWCELRPNTKWRTCCDRCRIDGAVCRASAKWPLAACNRCTAMGIDCYSDDNMYPIRDLSLVGWGSYMGFHACTRCAGEIRNCDRQRPCDSCIRNNEAHLCDDISVRTPGQLQRSTDCFRGRLALPPGPLYYLAMGYGHRGVDDVKLGNRLCHWIGALLCIHAKSPQHFCKVKLSHELEKLRREFRPGGMPPVLTRLCDMPYLLDATSLDYAISLNWENWYIPAYRHDFYARVDDASAAGFDCALKDYQLQWKAERRAAAAGHGGTVEEVDDAEEDGNNNNQAADDDQNGNGPNNNDNGHDNGNGGPSGGGPGNGGPGNGGPGNGGAGSGNGGGAGNGGGNNNGNNGHNSNNNSNSNNNGQGNDDDDNDEDNDQDAPGELVTDDAALAMDVDADDDGVTLAPSTSAPPATTTTTTAATNPIQGTGTIPQSQQHPGPFQTATITEAVMAGFTANRARHNTNATAQLQQQSLALSQPQGPNLTDKVVGMAQQYLTNAQSMSLAIANTSGQGQGQTQTQGQTQGQAQGGGQGHGQGQGQLNLTDEVVGMAQQYLTAAQTMSLAIANTSGQGQGQTQNQGQTQGQTQGQGQPQGQGQTQVQGQAPGQTQAPAYVTDEERAETAEANTPAAVLEEARARTQTAEEAMATAHPTQMGVIQASRDSGVPVPPELEPQDGEEPAQPLVPQLAQPPHPNYQQTLQQAVQQATQHAVDEAAAVQEAAAQAQIQAELDEQAAQQAAQQQGQQQGQQPSQQPAQQQGQQQGQQPSQQPAQQSTQQPTQQARRPTRPQLKRRGTPSVVSSHPPKRRAVGGAGPSRQAVATGTAPAAPLSPDLSGSAYPDPTRLASHNPAYGTADGMSLPQPAQMTAEELEEQDRQFTESQIALLAQANAMDTQVTTQSDADMMDVDDTEMGHADPSNMDPAMKG